MMEADCLERIGRIGTPPKVISFGALKLESNVDVVLTAKPRRAFLAYLRKIVQHGFGQFVVNATHLLEPNVSRSKIILHLLASHAWLEAF